MARTRLLLVTLLLFPAVVGSVACTSQADPSRRSGRDAAVDRAELALLAPLPQAAPPAPGTDALVDLGRMLYYDRRLSAGQDISCNSCHKLDKYGVDGEPTSEGHRGQKGTRNSPTVYNAAGHVAQFWDGRAPDVEAQAKGPILNPVEMAMPSERAVVNTLQSIPQYVAAFGKAFPKDAKPLTYDNMAKAIGAFERHLATPSRFDAYLRGADHALTAEEKKGLRTFLDAGCTSCHHGALVGGRLFQRLGTVKAYPRTDDPGRQAVTGHEADRAVFKVPSLRNVDKTGPYFHDGRVASLEQAVSEMGEYQLGKSLSPQEVGHIVAFLRVLTGPIPADYIKEPRLPK